MKALEASLVDPKKANDAYRAAEDACKESNVSLDNESFKVSNSYFLPSATFFYPSCSYILRGPCSFSVGGFRKLQRLRKQCLNLPLMFGITKRSLIDL